MKPETKIKYKDQSFKDYDRDSLIPLSQTYNFSAETDKWINYVQRQDQKERKFQ